MAFQGEGGWPQGSGEDEGGCLHKAEHSGQCVHTGAGGGLDMLIGPAARSRSLTMQQGLEHLG
jgi:hypothetical protein